MNNVFGLSFVLLVNNSIKTSLLTQIALLKTSSRSLLINSIPLDDTMVRFIILIQMGVYV